MERIVVGRSATLNQTFTSDGVPTAPTGTPTVTVTRDDGTVVTTSGVAAGGTTGVFTVTIPAVENQQLDKLTVTWMATVGGQPQEYVSLVEVAGGFLFSIAEMKDLLSDSRTSKTYTTAQIVRVRTRVEQAIEGDARGAARAFVPRYTRETISVTSPSNAVVVRWPDVRAVRSISTMTAGVATGYAASDLALTSFDAAGVIYTPTRFTGGTGNLTVAYEHGMDTAPEEITLAALLLARAWLVSGPIDSRALGFASSDGSGASYGLATPGRGGSRFGLPDVDAIVDGFAMGCAIG